MTIEQSHGQVIVWMDGKLDEDRWEYVVTLNDGKPTSVQESWYRDGEHESTRQLELYDVPDEVVEEVERHMVPRGAFTKDGVPRGGEE